MSWSMSEYEQKRLENIRKNRQRMQDLNIGDVKVSLGMTPPKSANRKRKKSSIRPDPPKILRRSLRTQGLTPDGEQAEKAVEYLELARQAEAQKYARKEGTFELKNTNDVEPSESKDFLNGLSSLSSRYSNNKQKTKKITGHSSLDIQNLALKEEGVKVLSKRTYCLQWLHSSERHVVAVGDKTGHIGLLDADLLAQSSGDDEIDPAYIFTYQPHSRPVSDLKYTISQRHKLFSSSYDGSVRYMDLEKAQSIEAYISDPDDNKTCCSMAMREQINGTGQVFFVSDNKGYVTLVDCRSSVDGEASYLLHEKKVGCVDTHPLNANLIVTSSNDSSVCLWDVRKIKSAKSHIKKLPHGRSVTSTYFSPSGRHLISTSYDDYIRLYTAKSKDVYDWDSVVRIRHNNQTGRWVTNFKAHWGASDEHFVVGNMSRAMDVFTVNTDQSSEDIGIPLLHELRHELLTAIPAVNAFHPLDPLVASSTASGYIYVWRQS